MEQELSLYTHHLIYGGLGLLALLLGIYRHIHWLWIQPGNEREEKQNERIAELETDNASLKEGRVKERIMTLEKEQLLQRQRLESGDRRFEEVCKRLKALEDGQAVMNSTLARIEGKMTNSVWRGVGEHS